MFDNLNMKSDNYLRDFHETSNIFYAEYWSSVSEYDHHQQG